MVDHVGLMLKLTIIFLDGHVSEVISAFVFQEQWPT